MFQPLIFRGVLTMVINHLLNSQRIHVWYIYLHFQIWLIYMVNVGKYTIHGSSGIGWSSILARTGTSADSSRNVLDGILIETTGLADPGDLAAERRGGARYVFAGRMGYIWMFPTNGGFSPKSSILTNVFHYFHHPFWGPTPIFGNTHMDWFFSPYLYGNWIRRPPCWYVVVANSVKGVMKWDLFFGGGIQQYKEW